MKSLVHRVRLSLTAIAFSVLALLSPASAQPQSADGVWLGLPNGLPREIEAGEVNMRPIKSTAWYLDVEALRQRLVTAPMEDTPEAERNPLILEIPMPDGRLATFAAVNSPVMEPELAARLPEVTGTYFVRGVDDPSMTGRIDLTVHGFHGMIFTSHGTAWMDPYNKREPSFIASYWRHDYARNPQPLHCLVDENTPNNNPEPPEGYGAARQNHAIAQRSGATRRTYRLAMAGTAEWTAVNGGTAAAGQATMVTATNRVTGIYERDMAIRLTLVANNINLIFTNTATDGYTNGAASTMLAENQTRVDAVIGSANYDVGHVVGTASGANGVAGSIGNVCSTSKAQGVSISTSVAMADTFIVDYIAHEMGHQFGGRHNFGNCSGGAGDSASLAVEPGSGSTIMGYAGICPSSNPTGGNNLQPNSHDYFNVLNIDQIITYVSSGTGSTCAASAATGNSAPSVSAGLDYTIPHSTPYILTATGSDPNSNPLTYCWEQADGGAGRALSTTSGTALLSGPIVRSRLPVSSPVRNVPPAANVLNNTLNAQELLAGGARVMNWRVTARDGLGGVWDDAMVLNVAATGPFRVTNPNTAGTFSGPVTVTWDLGGSNASPINTANVRILLSTDGGSTFPTVLSSSTPNTGSASVTLPNLTTSAARVRIEPIGNIYYDVSDANFSITPNVPVVNLTLGTQTLADIVPNGNANTRADPGESSLEITAQVVNNGTLGATGVSGTLSSLTATASIVPASATQPYPNLASGGGSGTNASPFILSVDSSHPCGVPVSLRLTVNATGEPARTFDFAVPVGQSGGPVTQTFSYTTPRVVIPSTGTPAVINLPVSGITGTVTDVRFRFDGSLCSTVAGSATVGLDHTWVGDLVITLTNPQGTVVSLINRPGGGTVGSSGNNFCQTVLDDAATNLIQGIVSTDAPHTGNWRPAGTLASFDGQNPNGNWVLTVTDAFTASDNGSVRAFSILITSTTSPICDPPVNPPAACNLSDVTDVGDTGAGPDGQLTVDDVITFVNTFSDGVGCPGSAPCNLADVTDVGETGAGPDGQLTVDDVIAFFNAFSDGCLP